MDIVKIEKSKNILNIILSNNRIYKIDFTTGNIIGVRGKVLNNNPFTTAFISFANSIDNQELWARLLRTCTFNPIHPHLNKNSIINKESIRAMEKFIPYLDLIDPFEELPPTIPTGYINWCKEKNEKISIVSYVLFVLERKNLSKKDYLRTKNLFYQMHLTSNAELFLISNDDFRKLFFKIIENDLKIFKLLSSRVTLFNYMKNIGTHLAAPNLGVTENCQIYENFLEKNKQELIAKKENKIKDLENIEHEKFCVFVPTKLQDFTDEGEQQHNCVGYYYHKDIVEGSDLIYFIRLKDSPKKSLNTCRYNLRAAETVENRTYCNHTSSKEVSNFIERIIDPKIREILNKQKEE